MTSARPTSGDVDCSCKTDFADETSAELIKNPQGTLPELIRPGGTKYEVDEVAPDYLANKALKKHDHGRYPRRANDKSDDTRFAAQGLHTRGNDSRPHTLRSKSRRVPPPSGCHSRNQP